MNDIAGVNQPQPDTSSHRSRILQYARLTLALCDLTLIEFHHSLVLMHRRLLGGELLLRDGFLRDQLLIADQIDARVLQRGLVPDQLPFGLGQCRLIRSVVDFHQQIALVNGVAFTIANAHQLPVDAGSNRNSSQGRNAPSPE